jgi:hypothetical protein
MRRSSVSTVEFPFDVGQVSRELEKSSSERRQEIADTVAHIVAIGPPEREPDVPNLLDMKGVLREEGDERERPGTTALMESRERDERKDEEMLERLRSDE